MGDTFVKPPRVAPLIEEMTRNHGWGYFFQKKANAELVMGG